MNQPDPNAVYTIETMEQITHVSRDRIVLYYRHGLITAVRDAEPDPLFDEDAVHKLRRIAFLLAEYEPNPAGLKVMASLLHEVERLRAELRFLRGR